MEAKYIQQIDYDLAV